LGEIESGVGKAKIQKMFGWKVFGKTTKDFEGRVSQ